MSIWDTYKNRITTHGETQRDVFLKREQRFLNQKLRNSLSYFDVLIDDEERKVSIIDSDNLNEKRICTLPGEDIHCGAIVTWMNNRWIVTEKDANNEVYTRAKLLQCNYLLKWVDDDDIIREQWCVIEDGTKYLTGEIEDRNFIVTRGDSRVAMTITRNEHTVKFGRKHRFIIDDPCSPDSKMAYALTKPLKVGKTYNDEGVFSFVLQEVTTTNDDNLELGIADYYKHFEFISKDEPYNPKKEPSISPDDSTTESGKKVWL